MMFSPFELTLRCGAVYDNKEIDADACSTPQSAADIVRIMFVRKLDSHRLSFAKAEALAHLPKLWKHGLLKRVYPVMELLALKEILTIQNLIDDISQKDMPRYGFPNIALRKLRF